MVRASLRRLAEHGRPEGDIILSYDGKPVARIDELHKLLTDAKVGVASPLTILRGPERLTLRVVPVELHRP